MSIKTRQKRRAQRLTVLVTASLLALAACGGSDSASSDGDSVTLVVGGISPADNPASVSFKSYLDDLAEQSDGSIEIEWHPGGELVPTPEALGALGEGTFDMLLSQPSTYAGTVPIGTWSDLPIFSPGYAESLGLFYDTDIRSIVDEEYQEKSNTKVIQMRVFNPYVFIMGKGKSIRSVDDFSGKKIRSAGGAQNTFLESLGAIPVELGPDEFYTSFQSGVIDGFILPLYSLETYKLGELAESVTLPGTGALASQLVWMNLDKWNSLSDEQQELIESTTDEDNPKQVTFWEDEEDKALEYAEGSDVEIIELSEAEQTRLRDEVGAVTDGFVEAEGDKGTEIASIVADATS